MPRHREIQRSLVLEQNHPNPFNPKTTISFAMPAAGEIALIVFDIRGRRVASLLEGAQYSAGSHSVVWDARDQASGIYFCRLTMGEISETSRMILLK